MMLGFVLASRLPVWVDRRADASRWSSASATLIRDNLTLNILMLIYPLEAVRHWQAGG